MKSPKKNQTREHFIFHLKKFQMLLKLKMTTILIFLIGAVEGPSPLDQDKEFIFILQQTLDNYVKKRMIISALSPLIQQETSLLQACLLENYKSTIHREKLLLEQSEVIQIESLLQLLPMECCSLVQKIQKYLHTITVAIKGPS